MNSERRAHLRHLQRTEKVWTDAELDAFAALCGLIVAVFAIALYLLQGFEGLVVLVFSMLGIALWRGHKLWKETR